MRPAFRHIIFLPFVLPSFLHFRVRICSGVKMASGFTRESIGPLRAAKSTRIFLERLRFLIRIDFGGYGRLLTIA
jgi:hypothetical protein